jgi:hypothetical protein
VVVYDLHEQATREINGVVVYSRWWDQWEEIGVLIQVDPERM